VTERIRLATRDTFRSLHNRNFRTYFVSQSISMTGTWAQLVAQALLVLSLGGNGTQLGLLTGVQFLPVLVFGPWAGVLSDRLDKRRLLLVTQMAMMASALALGTLVLTDHITIAWVFVLATATGVGTAFDGPARRSFVNELVDDEHIANAVSLNSTAVTAARLVGPAVAGILVATVGIGWCFVVNGVSFLAVIVGLTLLDRSQLRTVERLERGRGQIRAGFAYVWRTPDLRVPMVLMAVVGTLAFNWQVLVPLLATRELGGGSSTFTVLTSVMSVGSLVGSLALARRRAVDARFLGRACLAIGVSTGALAVAPDVVTASLAGIATGAAAMAFVSGAMTMVQLRTTPAMRGRVMALFTMVFLGSTPIGSPLIGWVAEHLGTRAGFGIGALAAVVAGLVIQRSTAPAPVRPARLEQAFAAGRVAP
jgi:MFS family permease